MTALTRHHELAPSPSSFCGDESFLTSLLSLEAAPVPPPRSTRFVARSGHGACEGICERPSLRSASEVGAAVSVTASDSDSSVAKLEAAKGAVESEGRGRVGVAGKAGSSSARDGRAGEGDAVAK